MTKKPSRSFSKEFKIEAVKLSESCDKSMEQVARELDVTSTMLYNWRKKYSGIKVDSSKTENSRSLTPEQRIKQLELENARLREDRDILKKVAVDSKGQCNRFTTILICRNIFDETTKTNIYSRRERLSL